MWIDKTLKAMKEFSWIVAIITLLWGFQGLILHFDSSFTFGSLISSGMLGTYSFALDRVIRK